MVKAYAAFGAGEELQPFEYEPEDLGRQEVEIEVDYCGICHSDLSMIDNEWGMSRYPLVPGHEVIGRITAVGSDVNQLQIGQHVGLGWHAGYCMGCPICLQGDHNMCPDAQGTIVGRHGGFADRVRAQEASVIPLPDGIDLERAGPLLCGGITVFNPLLQFGIKATDRIGVIGIGGLGHLALMFARAWGCQVTAFTSSTAKRDEALAMGAHEVIDSRDPEALKAAVWSFDLLIATVNVKLDWNAYIGTLKPRGRLHIVGATTEPLDIGVFGLLMGQRSVSSSPVGSPANMALMLGFAARHGIHPVTETWPMEKVNEALERLRSGQARYRIVLER